MKFFKPEDFGGDSEFTGQGKYWADLANAKLEREGKVLYEENNYWYWFSVPKNPTRKALLINIEEISRCDHSKEKVGYTVGPQLGPAVYTCMCGAKVEPLTFREVK